MSAAKFILFLYFVLFFIEFGTSKSNNGNRSTTWNINEKIDSSCSQSNTLIIKGYNVFFTQFISANGKLVNLCMNGARITTVVIYALYSVIIDQSWNATGESLQVVLVAPVWEIMGPINITLDGRKGDHHVPTKAKDGSIGSGQGEDGKPGLPGGPGGYFFGVGSVFINGGNLKISANGGDGGPGQHGGNGGVGNKGETLDPLGNLAPSSPDLRCETGLCNNGEGSFNNTHFKCKKSLNVRDKFPVFEKTCTIKVFGENGMIGGNGGNGGKGGLGGFAGNITIVEFNKESGIFKFNFTSSTGENGKGGDKAEGGECGDTIFYETTFGHNLTNYKYEGTSEKKYSTGKFAESGKPGKTGSVISEIKKPHSVNISISRMYSLVDEYIKYIEEGISVETKNYSLLFHFLNQFYCNEKWRIINMTNDASGFASAIKLIDNLILEENKTYIDVVPCYKLILGKITKYAESNGYKKVDKPSKKVLSYLHLGLLTKIYNLKDHSETNLVLYLDKYLNTTEKLLSKMRNKEIIGNTLSSLGTYFCNKLSVVELDKEEDIAYLLKDTQELMDKEITSVTPIVEQDTLSIIENENYRALDKHFEEALLAQAFMNAVKSINQLLQILLNISKFFGELFSLRVTTMVSLLLEKNPNLSSTGDIKEMIRNAKDRIKSFLENKMDMFKLLLQAILKKTKEYPESMKSLEQLVVGIFSKLNNISSFLKVPDFRRELIKALETQANVLLREKEKMLFCCKKPLQLDTYFSTRKHSIGKEKRSSNENRNEALKELNTINEFVSLGVSMSSIYTKYSKNKTVIKNIKRVLLKRNNVFTKLEYLEKKITQVVYSVLKPIESDLAQTIKRLDNNSNFTFDINKWKISSRLSTMRFHIEEAIKHLNSTENNHLFRCLQNIHSLLNNLMSLYGRISNNQEKLNLNIHIQDILSEEAKKIKVYDPKLKTVFNQSKVTISAGLVLLEYRTVYDAFKKFVFPLASLYLKDIIDPRRLLLEGGGSLVNKTLNEISSLQKKLYKYQNSLRQIDGVVGLVDCKSLSDYTTPLFVWKNQEYREEISKLLSGQKVLLKAGIPGSDRNENAMRIKSFQIKFKGLNKSVQSGINHELEVFQVDATHLGDSFYKCDGKTYILNSHPLNVWFNLLHNDGKPMEESVTNVQLRKGLFMVSPFATWQMKLVPIFEESSFDVLETYKGKVDLELVGESYYVKSEETGCFSLEIEKFYEPNNVYKKF